MTSLLERSLSFTTTEELDNLSKSLESTARQFYQQSKEMLKADAASGRIAPQHYAQPDMSDWPAPVRNFWESGESERFNLSGLHGDHLDYLARDGYGVRVYSKDLGDIRMADISAQYTR